MGNTENSLTYGKMWPKSSEGLNVGTEVAHIVMNPLASVLTALQSIPFSLVAPHSLWPKPGPVTFLNPHILLLSQSRITQFFMLQSWLSSLQNKQTNKQNQQPKHLSVHFSQSESEQHVEPWI